MLDRLDELASRGLQLIPRVVVLIIVFCCAHVFAMAVLGAAGPIVWLAIAGLVTAMAGAQMFKT